jgi:NTE family protein
MRVAIVAVIAMGAAIAVHSADTDEQSPRPRIGLVLSGGGARGAAHIGVIEVLEELHIPVDCISGTSMGSIIGGLYAAGYSPEEMKSEIAAIDWVDAFNDKPPRKNINFRRKEDDRRSLFALELGIGKGGIKLPAGLLAGQKLNFILRRLTLHVRDVDDFGGLYVPYRAVATDLETGNAVVIGSGQLADAMRASMSIPSVFAPAEIDGRLLVDGGMAMNLPVEVAQEMCADVIIAVDVGTPPGELEHKGIFGVASHSISVMSKRNVGEQMELLREGDVLMVPDLSKVATADFDKLMTAVDRGLEVAHATESDLRRFSVSDEEFEQFLSRQRRAPVGEPPIIDEVEVTGLNRLDPRIVKRRIETRPGDVFDVDAVAEEMRRINRIGAFEHVDFQLKEEQEGNRLVIDAREKSWGPGFIRMGLELESDLEGSGEFGLLANYRRAHLNRFDAEWKTILEVGDEDSLFSEFYQPMGFSGFWFVAPQILARRDEEDIFLQDGSLGIVDAKERGVGLDLGVNFRSYGEIRVGAQTGKVEADLVSGTLPESLDIDVGAWVARVTLDRTDNANFPRSGSFAKGELFLSREGLDATVEYEKLELRFSQVGSFGKHTFFGSLDYGDDLGSDIPFYDEFRLGGFLNLSGLPSGKLSGDTYGLATGGYYWQIAELPGLLGTGVYTGLALQGGNVWADSDDADINDLIGSGTLFVGADTILGATYLAYGRTDDGDDSFYLVLGRIIK